jgi:hypothetical protein
VGFAVSAIGLLVLANPYDLIPPSLDPVRIMHGWGRFADDAEELRQQSGLRWIAAANHIIGAVLIYHLRDTTIPIVDVSAPVRYVFAPPPDPALRAEPALLVSDHAIDPKLLSCFAELTPLSPAEADRVDRAHQVFAYRAERPIPGLFKGPC